MKVKSIIALLLALIMAFGLVACGNTGTTTTPSTPSNPTTPSTPSDPTTPSEPVEEDYDPITLVVNFTCSAEYGTAVYFIQEFCDKVTERTNGKVTFEYYYSNSLLPIMEIPQGVAQGIADISYSAHYMYYQVFPLVSKITGMPFVGMEGVQETTDTWWYLYEKFPEMQAEFTNAGLLNLTTYAMPPYQLYMTTTKEIRTPADLAGVQIITQNNQVSELLTAANAIPVNQGLGDWYTSLSYGVADGISANVLSVTDLSGCGELVKQCVLLGETGTHSDVNGFIMNLARFQSLPASVQEIITQTAKEFTEFEVARYISVEEERFKTMTDNGAIVTELTEEEVAAFAALVANQHQATIDGYEAKGMPAQEIYDAMMDYINNN